MLENFISISKFAKEILTENKNVRNTSRTKPKLQAQAQESRENESDKSTLGLIRLFFLRILMLIVMKTIKIEIENLKIEICEDLSRSVNRVMSKQESRLVERTCMKFKVVWFSLSFSYLKVTSSL